MVSVCNACDSDQKKENMRFGFILKPVHFFFAKVSSSTTMDFKPSVSALFGHYSLPGPRILTKLGRTKFEKPT